MATHSRSVKGGGSVFPDPDKEGRWIAEVSFGTDKVTGRRKRIRARGSSRGDAAKNLRQAIKDAAAEQRVEGPRTVGYLLDAWLEKGAPSRRGRKSESGLARDRYLVRKHIGPELGKYAVTELRAEHIEKILAKRSHLSKDTLHKIRGVLSQAYDWAIGRRNAEWNPAKVAALPQHLAHAKEGRALTVAEVETLRDVASQHRLGAWVEVTLTLALRPGETSALHWTDVDLEKGTVVVHRSLAWVNNTRPVLKGTKTGRTRIIELPSDTVMALRDHRRRQMEERLYAGTSWPTEWDGLVFRSQTGMPLQPGNLRRHINTMATKAGIEGVVNPYDLRHTATTRLSEQGVAPELLADLLGHRDTRMVFKHYRHPVTPTISVAARHIEDALRAADR